MNNPYLNSNKRGIPTIAVSEISSNGTVTILTLPERTFWGKWYQGLILLEIDQDITAQTSTNTLSLQVNNELRPLKLANGQDATIANIAGSGAVFQVFYDKQRNLVQLMTMVPAAGTYTAGGSKD